ncbi:MAG: hypothetical protein Q4D13_04800 [Erysipelotrichaceae bacterium]|nr:hypothetical protein [Erysipelotrichaceae bacterium]
MDLLIYAVLVLALGFVIYKNIFLIKRMKYNNRYIECYKAMLNDDEGAEALIDKTIAEEPSEEFKSKTRFFKLYYDMDKEDNIRTCVDDIDMKAIFFNKGQIDRQKANLNSDSFLWLMMDMAKARKVSRFDVMDALLKKVTDIDELSNRLERKLVEVLYQSLKEEGDRGLPFFKEIIDGGYYEMQYDKQMIGLYKNISAVMLDVNGELFDEYYKEDLKKFVKTLIGGSFMKLVGNYDKFAVVDEETETVEETVTEDTPALEEVPVEEETAEVTKENNTEE